MMVFHNVSKGGMRSSHKLTIRQKVPLTAPGIVSRGLGVSDAARPTSSVPAIARVNWDLVKKEDGDLQKEKAAVTKTAQTPLKPLANAPGSFQSAPPE